MAQRQPYCSKDDLEITGVRLPQLLSAEGAVADASDEIDASIGSLYVTPIALDENDPEKRQDTLLLKSICKSLASGRLLLAASAGGEQTQVHAYGRYLVGFAKDKIKQIQSEAIILTSATRAPSRGRPVQKGAVLVQGQGVSMVDDFYSTFQPDGFVEPRPNAASSGAWPHRTGGF